ncbi:hypothetical protein F2P81_004522 [Scophthalmus maximus]|uniref:Uncharacterized protein n=1 Tax=Scophthalmus maximus TaxID=52904 RepID=A0A6A4TDA3_SCOMX|nr:hypothetical protein F2P81_004522 [Scophthalmus maximus]
MRMLYIHISPQLSPSDPDPDRAVRCPSSGIYDPAPGAHNTDANRTGEKIETSSFHISPREVDRDGEKTYKLYTYFLLTTNFNTSKQDDGFPLHVLLFGFLPVSYADLEMKGIRVNQIRLMYESEVQTVHRRPFYSSEGMQGVTRFYFL